MQLEEVGKLLRRIEAYNHADGWHDDAHMTVYAIYDHHDVVTATVIQRATSNMGKPIRNSRYSAAPMIPPRMFDFAFHRIGLQPSAALERFAFNAAYIDENTSFSAGEEWVGESTMILRRMLRMPGILGFAISSEAYGNKNVSSEQLRPYVHIGETEGAKELRTVLMVDMQDRVHAVVRHRGEPAELTLDSKSWGGPANCLRMMVDTALDRVPRTEEEFNERYPRARDFLIRQQEQEL